MLAKLLATLQLQHRTLNLPACSKYTQTYINFKEESSNNKFVLIVCVLVLYLHLKWILCSIQLVFRALSVVLLIK